MPIRPTPTSPSSPPITTRPYHPSDQCCEKCVFNRGDHLPDCRFKLSPADQASFIMNHLREQVRERQAQKKKLRKEMSTRWLGR